MHQARPKKDLKLVCLVFHRPRPFKCFKKFLRFHSNISDILFNWIWTRTPPCKFILLLELTFHYFSLVPVLSRRRREIETTIWAQCKLNDCKNQAKLIVYLPKRVVHAAHKVTYLVYARRFLTAVWLFFNKAQICPKLILQSCIRWSYVNCFFIRFSGKLPS